MWPFKKTDEHSLILHKLLLVLSVLTLASSLLVLFKVKLLLKEEMNIRDSVSQLQANMQQLGGKINAAERRTMQDRMMQPMPMNQAGFPERIAPTPAPAPAPVPSAKK